MYPKPDSWTRTSGCTGGVTAVASIERPQPASVSDEFNLSPGQINHLVEMLFESQELYRETGGVHTSALSDGEKVILSAEDIGRHNTLDKIAGLCLMENIWPEKRILITTGRISSEMLQKGVRMGAKVVASRTSPSSMSIELAEAWGITLIGYARSNRFNLYAASGANTSQNHPAVLNKDGFFLPKIQDKRPNEVTIKATYQKGRERQ